MLRRASSPGDDYLPCNCIVFRALTGRKWIHEDTGAVKADAFMRRASDDTGLSVNIATETNAQEFAESFSFCAGLVTLHVGSIRDLDLDVIPDERPHALIVGLPAKGEDVLKAEYLAGELAKHCRRVTV
jgi:hypothetical protein